MAEILFLTVLMLLGMGAYWAMILFPRQRDFQKRQKMARSLSAGDEVITFGGIIGRVQAVDAEQGIAHVEIARGVTVRLVTAAIVQEYNPEEIAENARKGLGTSENIQTDTTA